jgi:hypothetical protein
MISHGILGDRKWALAYYFSFFLDHVMRVNSANVLDEGLRIRGRGRWINSKVKISQTRRGLVYIENKRGTSLAQSQSVPGRPLLAPLYRWPGLEELVGFNTNYNVCYTMSSHILTISMLRPF